eukprot:Clim_evm13s38 gene=Clim_evmTU13s38
MTQDYGNIGVQKFDLDSVAQPISLRKSIQLIETPTRGNKEIVSRKYRDNGSLHNADADNDTDSKAKKRLNHRVHLVDSKYAYGQVVVLFICSLFSGMLGLTWGVWVPRLAEEFDQSLALSSWPGAIAMTLRAACAPLAGAWAIRFGSQRVILFGGLLAGIGCLATSFANDIFEMYASFGFLVGWGLSLTLYPAIGLVNQWFKQKKAVMMGIGASGTGVGGLIYAPFKAYLIRTIGWRDTFRVSALLVLVLTAIAALLAEDRMPPKKEVKKTKIPWHMFRDGRFTLTWISNVLFSFGYPGPFFYLVTWGEMNGLSHSMAALGAGLLSGANGASKPMQGYIGDKIGRDKVLYCSLALAGVMLFVWTLCRNVWSIYIFAIISGWSTGGQFGLQACILSDWYSDMDNTDIVGLGGSGRAVGELVGPVAIGAVIASSPTGAFMMSGGLMLGSALCCLLASLWPAITGRNEPDASTKKSYTVTNTD